jgi:hypothetical protein
MVGRAAVGRQERCGQSPSSLAEGHGAANRANAAARVVGRPRRGHDHAMADDALDLGVAGRLLDELADRMSGDLLGLQDALADLARLAVAWHDLAVRVEDDDPVLAAQLHDVVAAIRSAGAATGPWVAQHAAVAGRAGRVADGLATAARPSPRDV